MDEREKLAADLWWCEHVIQRCRDPAVVAAAKRWLVELELLDPGEREAARPSAVRANGVESSA
jgi:hypothetical protein